MERIAIGMLASEFWWRSGLATTIHELGHCVSGLALYRYLPGQGPMMEVNQLVRLSEGNWRAYFTAGNLNGGAAWVHHGISRFDLSFDARRCIVAISGSAPQLFVDGSLVTSDDELLWAAGLLNHLKNSLYPIDGWLGHAPHSGHDFANFAKHLSNITSLSPKVILGTTAILWSASVPSIALCHRAIAFTPVQSANVA